MKIERKIVVGDMVVYVSVEDPTVSVDCVHDCRRLLEVLDAVASEIPELKTGLEGNG